MSKRQKAAQVLPGKRIYAKAVILDTGALLALANSNDSYHQSASKCLELIAKHKLPLFILLPTIYEAHRRILFDLGQQAASHFLHQIYDGSVNVERTINEDEQQARVLIEKYAALRLTLTDAANMVAMKRLGIAAAFSYDRHFLQVGFIRIPPFHLEQY